MSRLQEILSQSTHLLQHQGGCGTCPRKMVDFVPPTLGDDKLIVVGEGPGKTEVETQEGFTGQAGDTMRDAFRSAGITSFSCSNTIHCRTPNNRDPSAREVSCCMHQHVIHEVAAYPFIVLVGSVAIKAFFPGQGTSRFRGNLCYHPDFPGSRIYSMLHPAALSYNPGLKDRFEAQVGRLSRILRGDPLPFTLSDDVVAFASMLGRAQILSLDLETNRLESWLEPRVINALAVCEVPGSVVYTFHKDHPEWRAILQLAQWYLQSGDRQVLGQNIGFDLVWLETVLDFRCDLKHIHEIQSLYYQLKGLKQVSLKRLVGEELDGYRHMCPWPHLETDPTRLRWYVGEDVYYPQKLFLQDFPKLRPRTRDLLLTVAGPSSYTLRRITHAGIHVRSGVWDELDQKYAQLRRGAVANWQKEDALFDPSIVTPTGFKDLDGYLFDRRQYPVLRSTPSGKRSTDEAVIKELIFQGYTELHNLLDIRGIDKRRSTYIKNIPKLLAATRRIHSSYHNTTTKTGRTSSTDPNMQNQPRGELRSIFGAPDGSKMVEGDFSQIELRIAMCLAGQENGMQAYHDGKDLHGELAAFLSGSENYSAEERTRAKSANFALIYGGGPATLREYAANNYGLIMSEAESNEWHGAFFRRWDKLPAWHRYEIDRLRQGKGYLESVVGHVWYYLQRDHADAGLRTHDERSAINMTCQGPASYMMTYLISLIQRRFWRDQIPSDLGVAEIVLTVHDSFACEVHDEYEDAIVRIVEEELPTVAAWVKEWFVVPLVLDMKSGNQWDALKEIGT